MSISSPAERIRKGIEHHRAGRLSEASECYLEVLDRMAEHPDARHLLGLIAHQSGMHDQAIDLISGAIRINPSIWAYHHNLGDVLRKVGRLREACDAYRQAVQRKPDHFTTHYALGLVLQQLGEPDMAVPHFWRALTLNPEAPDLHHRLGVMLGRKRRLDEAANLLRQAEARAPGAAPVHYDLGIVLAATGLLADAEAKVRRAIAIDKEFAPAHCLLGALCLNQNRLDDAEAAYRRAVALAPADSATARRLAVVLERRGANEDAIAIYRALIEREGDQPELQFYLAALGSAPVPASAPQSFVVDLFDGYAAHFDRHLAHLGYRTPQLLFDAVAKAAGDRRLDILDLGCGTGLCGPLVKPLARTLRGVDLSPAMLEIARARNVYDSLDVAELVEALRAEAGSLDLVLGADVFVYLGDLSPVFGAAATALRPSGLFAFSVEAELEGDGYALDTTRRYVHTLPYLERLAARYDFEIEGADIATLRMQAKQPVDGYIVVLRRSSRPD
jgi:predicted TPR repeat methyltransferase